MKTILQGVVGSTAYGLTTPTSDVDRLAVHLGPIDDVLSFGLTKAQQTQVTTEPDSTSHDVAKFLSLVLKGNPTVCELLWLDEYDVITAEGQRLIDNRGAFIGAKQVLSAYGGYAMHQINRLMTRGDSFSADTRARKSKHARHCLRLLLQGEELLRTGRLRIALDDGQKQVIWYASSLAESGEHDRLKNLYDSYDRLLKASYEKRCVLRSEPDRQVARETLQWIRLRQMGVVK